jgi:hypothetical protein
LMVAENDRVVRNVMELFGGSMLDQIG